MKTEEIAKLKLERETYRIAASRALTQGAYEARMFRVREIDALLWDEGAE